MLKEIVSNIRNRNMGHVTQNNKILIELGELCVIEKANKRALHHNYERVNLQDY